MKRKDDERVSITYCEKLAHEAEIARVWIHIGKKWFTPDEFIKYANSKKDIEIPYLTNIMSDEIQTGDPRKLVKPMDVKIQEMIDSRNKFVQRILEYYK